MVHFSFNFCINSNKNCVFFHLPVFGVLMAVFEGMPYAAAVELFLEARPSELSSLVMLGLGVGIMVGGPLAGKTTNI